MIPAAPPINEQHASMADVIPIETPSLTTGQVAGLLGLNPETVRRLVRRGDLRAYRIAGQLRFTRHDVNRLAFGDPVQPTVPIKLPDPIKIAPRSKTTGVARLDEIEREAQQEGER